MFDSLTEKLSSALRNLRGVGQLSEANMEAALQEVRTALLSADVHFRVTREFIEKVKAKAVGQEVLKGVNPGQQIVKIINDELVALLGEGTNTLSAARPLKILMVGLHGSGKTTSTAKLGRLLKKKGYNKPFAVACDIYRPAAIDQLEILSKQEELGFYADRASRDVPAIGAAGLDAARAAGADLILFDTAGRLQIDADLIEEVKKLRDRIQPDEIILVADGALGQEAVNVAKAFHEALKLTGLILTKLDGDARGGAALSIKSITGVPIKFVGTGEKTSEFDVFHPDRLASRILGMGDVVSLVEKAAEVIDQKEAEKMAEKMRKADFTLEDFLAQMQQIKKLGSLGGIMGMMPGMSGMKIDEDAAESGMKRTEAIILSMTFQERRKPDILNGSRRLRIANGAGVKVVEVNQLLKQFQQMQQMMKMLKGGGSKKMMRQLKEMERKGGPGGGMGGGGFGGFGGGMPRF